MIHFSFIANAMTMLSLRGKNRLPGKKQLLFSLIMFILPVLFLGLVELALRLAGFGYDCRLFVESPADNRYLIFNPAASKRYFPDEAIATTGNHDPFRKIKDPHTIRIFVLGESTTIGYPYFHSAAFPRLLQYRLTHTAPDQAFEFINLSLTAVNSFTIAGFARELVDYSPDAVLIYTGHNEYYGALGAGSAEQLGRHTWLVKSLLWLRGFRLTQGLDLLFRKKPAAQAPAQGKTRMAFMAGNQEIALGSTVFEQGIRQFSSNISETLKLLSDKGIPVFISNLVCNEKDLAPFISSQAPREVKRSFDSTFTNAENFIRLGRTTEAIAALQQARRLYPQHAKTWYDLGRLYFFAGDTMQAKTCFDSAIDLDMLRFRAPGRINAVLPGLCSRYPGVHLVDANRSFAAASPGHCTGNELLLEHVHPNVNGYALLADLFLRSLLDQGIVRETAPMDFATFRRGIPVTRMDSLAGAYKIFKLRNSWPFTTLTNKDTVAVNGREEQLAYGIAFHRLPWAEAISDLYNVCLHRQDLPEALKVMESLVMEFPGNASFFEKAANLSGQLRDYPAATLYFKRSFDIEPSFEKARDIFVLYLKLDDPAAAQPFLRYAMENNSSRMDLSLVQAGTLRVLQLKTQITHAPTDKPLLNAIAETYLAMGNREGAQKYARKVLELDTGDTTAIRLIHKLKI